MSILIDPPLWPAHGTAWSHLVSDTSLDELHDFGERAALPRRSFDLDHYDVPAERYDEFLALGAVATERRELLARLAASGLRVRGGDRPAAKRAALAARWDALLPGEPTIGTDLLDRWYEAHRAYHGPGHLTHVLDSLLVLSPAPLPREVPLALWFHDAVHAGTTPADEEASAALATDLLRDTGPDAEEVSRLVLVTAQHDPEASDRHGALVSDADLAVLGSAPDRYRKYTRQVRQEYREVPDEVFYPARAAVLDGLLAGPALFRTEVGAARWEAGARRNLHAELTEIGAQLG